MHPLLLDAIVQFRSAQDRGVAAILDELGPALGVRLPTSNREWVSICAELGLYNVQRVNNIKIYTHGYGIELIFPELTIDFDWGENGEPDGFDTWRLWNHININKIPIACDYDRINSWMQQAHQVGELIRDSMYGLYYSPNHRASKPVE